MVPCILRFRGIRTTVCHTIVIMGDDSKAGKKLSEKVRKGMKVSVPSKIKQENIASVSGDAIQATQSPYFSPRKTRNQVKIEYEKSNQQNVPQIKREKVEKEDSEAMASITDVVKEKKSLKTTKKRSNKTQDLSTVVKEEKQSKWEPDHWREVLENLKIMRKSVPAPVDTMGCDQCSDEIADEKTQRFHKLLALMLSSQTKDQVTFEAMNRLKARGQLTPESIINWEATDLENTLMPVSFYKNKAKYIQKTAQILINDYNSDIPDTLDGLMKLPGVGPKMAHICMNSAWNIISGIGVDVHVHRICNRLKWVRKPTKQPEETRVELESWLPAEHWSEVNGILVGFGQTICAPVYPKCGVCLNNQICPSAFISKKKSPKA